MRITKLLLKDGQTTQILDSADCRYTYEELKHFASTECLFLCDMSPATTKHIKQFTEN